MAEVRRLAVEHAGASIAVDYSTRDADAYLRTLKRAHRSTALPADGTTEWAAMHLGIIDASVRRWDLQDDDGAQVPVNAAAIASLPGTLLAAVIKAIYRDRRHAHTKRGGR